jgi:hypothetical protein
MSQLLKDPGVADFYYFTVHSKLSHCLSEDSHLYIFRTASSLSDWVSPQSLLFLYPPIYKYRLIIRISLLTQDDQQSAWSCRLLLSERNLLSSIQNHPYCLSDCLLKNNFYSDSKARWLNAKSWQPIYSKMAASSSSYCLCGWLTHDRVQGQSKGTLFI